jgi:hypothetical protein
MPVPATWPVRASAVHAPDWSGERGRLTADVLRRLAPTNLTRWDFFLCGAGAPVDSVGCLGSAAFG